MRFYLPIAKVDAEQRMVYGYASTEARDDQGEVIRRAALQGALADYMQFANIREMHQLSAVGKAKEAEVDDKGLYVGAKVVDPVAWAKVQEGVYSGFSIGGKVTQRDPQDRSVITGIRLDEISLVDRPANPEALFDCWKRSAEVVDVTQIWDCGTPGHRHAAKAEALKCVEAAKAAGGETAAAIAAAEDALAKAEAAAKAGDDGKKPEGDYGDVEYADPGYQEDKKPRYPVDTEEHIRAAWEYINKPKNAGKYSEEQVGHIKAKIVAAWKSKIDKDGPPSADKKEDVAKALSDAGWVAGMIVDLNRLRERLALETAMENDDSGQPAAMRAIVEQLCAFLNALVAEETAEILSGDEADALNGPYYGSPFFYARVAETLKAAGLADAAERIGKMGAKHNAADQAHLDLAAHCAKAAMAMPSCSKADAVHLGEVAKAVADAGATDLGSASGGHISSSDGVVQPGGATQHSTVDTGHNAETSVPHNPAGPGPTDNRTAKAGAKAHQMLLDTIHNCLKAVSDGATCKEDAAKPERHSAETMAHLDKAHFHLRKCGAMKCDAAIPGGTPETEGEEENEGAKEAAAAAADLAKRLADEGAEKALLVKTLGDLVPRIEALQKRVEDIAKQPLPAATVTRMPNGLLTLQSLSKAQDNAGTEGTTLSDEQLAEAIAKMSHEERTLLLIKASRLAPMTPPFTQLRSASG